MISLQRVLYKNRPPPEMQIDGEDAWIVEKVLNKRIKNKLIEYLVKWEDYPDWESTWEPVTNLQAALDVIREYEDEHAV